MNCDIVFHLNVLLYFLQCIEYDFPSNVFCSVEWFDYVEWCALRWKICTTFNDFYYVERFVECLMILTTLNYSECDGWFAQRWIIWITMDYWEENRHFNPKTPGGINLTTSTTSVYSRKYCQVFYTNLCVDFFSWSGNIKKKYIQHYPRNWS